MGLKIPQNCEKIKTNMAPKKSKRSDEDLPLRSAGRGMDDATLWIKDVMVLFWRVT